MREAANVIRAPGFSGGNHPAVRGSEAQSGADSEKATGLQQGSGAYEISHHKLGLLTGCINLKKALQRPQQALSDDILRFYQEKPPQAAAAVLLCIEGIKSDCQEQN